MIHFRSFSIKSPVAKQVAKAVGAVSYFKKKVPLHIATNDVLLNWGSSIPLNVACPILNHPQAVACAVDKVACFIVLNVNSVPCVEVSSYSTDAENWLSTGNIVIARSLVKGSRGKGITVCHTKEELLAAKAKFYTKYVPKNQEFRVYVFQGEVLAVLKKRRSKKAIADGTVNKYIKTHKNGWIFCRNNVNPDPQVLENAVNAVAALGLDFGGVDIIWSKSQNKALVLEVNTAPGLTATNLLVFSDAVKQYAKKLTGF